MKILTLRPQIEIGGVRTTLTNLSVGLHQQGYYSIIATANEEEPKYLEQRNIKVVQFALYPSTPSNLLRSVRQVINFVKTEKIDLIHSCHRFTSIVGRIACWRTNIPLVVSAHEIKDDKRFLSFLWTSHFNIVPSQALKEHLVSYYGLQPNKIHVIPNAIDPNRIANLEQCNMLRRTLLKGNTSPTLGYIGRLSPEKGVRYFIDSIELLRNQNHYVKALIVGGGPEEASLRAQVSNLQLDNWITFLGMRNDISELMEIIDIVVLPSISESFGNVALEAMIAERPVVATFAGGLPEVVRDGVSGSLVPSKSPDRLAEAIATLVLNPEMRQQYGKNGRQIVLSEYSIDKMVSSYIAVFKDAIAQKQTK